MIKAAAVVEQIARGARDQIGDAGATTLAAELIGTSTGGTLPEEFLTRWCHEAPLPTVLLLDEVDALVGDTLISLLRQLRAGDPKRPTRFPQTAILCGVQDLQDYRIHSSGSAAAITGGSAFNIKAKSLRLGDFSQTETAALLTEHTLVRRGPNGPQIANPIYREVIPRELTQIARSNLEVQRAVIELKVLHKALSATLAEGLAQTADYADRCGAQEAHVLIFDRTPGRTWDEKIWRRTQGQDGRSITVWGL